MAEVLCNGVMASPCGGDVGVSGRVARGAAAAESVSVGGYGARSSFAGGRISVAERKARPLQRSLEAGSGQMNRTIPKSMRWWEKGVQPNMREIESAQDLADSLLSAGDQLVVVDFFSPGCSGCRALHPKIAQFAERNPDVLFLQVNYETHKSMCYSLHVHVLPFFRFYRGAQGRVSSFSCTNATIKKFKDALAKHGPERCSLGPARGLEESELMALATNRDLEFTYEKPLPPAGVVPIAEAMAKEATAAALGSPWFPYFPLPTQLLTQGSETESLLLPSGR